MKYWEIFEICNKSILFSGGIVLALGCMAISFVAWKFYKARTERNYHTL
jgi:Multi-glycosylated core protein 24 (MGC-24), sialomucin